VLFYYQIVTCLLVTCAAPLVQLPTWSACRCDCLCFPVKTFFQWRDLEWTYQTKNGQRVYDVGRSVLWGED